MEHRLQCGTVISGIESDRQYEVPDAAAEEE
jgi:hypothetical protein